MDNLVGAIGLEHTSFCLGTQKLRIWASKAGRMVRADPHDLAVAIHGAEPVVRLIGGWRRSARDHPQAVGASASLLPRADV